mmetsp:Transcript_75057/g.244010  ORF Transcript_75057/g.244010 Transcript_75057/m.244010 type:complete len:623 (+) Transcript_75057:62-1930(+)
MAALLGRGGSSHGTATSSSWRPVPSPAREPQGQNSSKAIYGAVPPLIAEYAFAGVEGSHTDFTYALSLAGWDAVCGSQMSSAQIADTLISTLSWLTGWSEAGGGDNRLEQIRRAIEQAEAAGAQEDLLDTMRAKLEELEYEVRREHTISVRDEETGATVAVVRSLSTDTLASIGETVRREIGDCENSLHFRLGDNALDNSWTLAEAGISNGDVVSLVRTPLCWRSSSHESLTALAAAHAASPAALAASPAAAPVLSASLSPCGNSIFTRADNGEGKVWCAQTGTLLCELSGQVLSGVFSSDGRWLLGASDDSTARIWCTETGRCSRTLFGHADCVKLAAFSPEGRWIATASSDSTACLWTADEGQRVTAFVGHQKTVNSIAFSPNGLCAVTASTDGTARIWKVPSGHCESVLDAGQALRTASYSPCGTWILTVSTDGVVQLWQASCRGSCSRTLTVRSKPVYAATFSPDSCSVLVASASESLDIFSVATCERRLTLAQHTDWVRSASFSPDGLFVASASHDGTARIWSAETGRCLLTLSGHSDWVGAAFFSSDSRLLVTASYDGTARLWSALSGESIHVLVGNTDWVRAAACSPRGSGSSGGSGGADDADRRPAADAVLLAG